MTTLLWKEKTKHPHGLRSSSWPIMLMPSLFCPCFSATKRAQVLFSSFKTAHQEEEKAVQRILYIVRVCVIITIVEETGR